MIAALRFGQARRLADGRRLRAGFFEPRSTLPPATACAIANGVRERLHHLLAADVAVDLIEPTLPSVEARRTLFAGAHVSRATGSVAVAYVVVRPADARRLVDGAFREPRRAGDAPSLSEIESRVLERIVAAIAPLCTPLCGPLGAIARVEPERAIRECATYFEVRALGPLHAAIGFALTRDPPEEVREPVRLAELGDVPLEARVELGRGRMPLPAIASLRAGAVIPLSTELDEPGALALGGVVVARGPCGTREGRRAISIEEPAAAAAA